MSRANPQQQQRPTAAQQQTTFDPSAALLDEIMEKTVSNLDKCAERFTEELANPAIGRLKRAIVLGMAISRLRTLITRPIIDMLMSLANTNLGFNTDRGPKSKQEMYPESVVVDCAIEALLQGVLWTGNQFNIIAGKCYITQAGYYHKLRETRGLTDLQIFPGVPIVRDGQTCVRFGAEWKYNGIKNHLKDAKGEPGRTFSIITTQYSTPDATVGKAIRKGLKAIYDLIHGSEHTGGDDDAAEVTEQPPSKPAETPAATNGHTHTAPPTQAPQPAPALAEGEIPNDQENGDLAEYTAEEILSAIAKAGISDVGRVWQRYGVRRAPDLTPAQRRELMAELQGSASAFAARQ